MLRRRAFRNLSTKDFNIVIKNSIPRGSSSKGWGDTTSLNEKTKTGKMDTIWLQYLHSNASTSYNI